MASIYDPIPNSPFSSPRTYSIDSPLGGLIVGSGLAVDQYGNLIAASTAGGTVTAITFGTGFFDPPQTITVTGSVNLLPASATQLGGVKAGANVTIAPDGTISVAPPGIGTITAVIAGTGLNGGAIAGAATLSLNPATTSALGGIIVGNGLSVSGGSVSVRQASPSVFGGSTLATAAEVISGTDAQKIVTPQTLSAKVASTSASGLVQLSDLVGVTDSTKAATPTAITAVATLANAAQATATAALPKAGGTMTGVITFAAGQTFPGVALPIATTNSLGVISVGPGLQVNSSGVLSTLNNGTVTAVTAGPGLGAPVSGNTISTSGSIRLLPPTTDGLTIGGVKAGTANANVAIAADGTITVGGFINTNNPYSFNGYVWPVADGFGFLPGADGQVLTVVDKTSGAIGWTNTGTLTTVQAGTGIAVSSTATTATVSLATVGGLVPGNYGATALIPTLTVNAQGQLTSVGTANIYAPFKTASFAVPPNLVLDFSGNDTNFTWTLTQNTTIPNPLNAESGQVGALLLTQDNFVPYSVTWGAAWKWAGAAPYGGNPLPGTVDLIQYTVIDTNYIVVTNVIQGIG
jgi:hypothetical protein